MGKVLERALTEITKQSPDLLAEMADEAIREDEAGLTEPLDPEKL